MPKEVNGWNDRVLSQWFPTGKNFHASVGSEEGRGRGGAQPNEGVI